MKGPNEQLQRIVKRNLRSTIVSAVAGAGVFGIVANVQSGVLGAAFIGLLPWRDALEDFDRDV